MDASRFPSLDPELRAIVELLPETVAAFDDIPAVRAMFDAWLPAGPVPGEETLDITDEVVDGVPVRTYRPREAAGDLPGILYLHGGGFCIGSIETEHGGAVALANALPAVVVSVDYRLAPEHPYPAGLEDCYRGLQHLAGLAGVDPARLAVHGQSAGGGLAAATALLARDRGGPALRFQSLGIPELDDRLGTPSMTAFTDTPMWSRPQAVLSWQHYLGGRPADGYAAPARMENLAGLPPAYVVTCELDPLRDEGIEYAMRMLAAGVSVELHTYPGTFHGAQLVPAAAVVQRMNADLLAALRRALAPAEEALLVR
ncbi:alpha/beta hydrolase [Nocardioides marmoriginsengisoli]|uniref:Alpha/beta hydrolase n=1 Tax=Nocardioides marmoriginsengisoli TaxID=661483 RepID=A0A3N0CA92_9ACTN|nr:alpha/beta hydrolase [Nocardioides marmoriginsengisoli]RNL60377.1 alpha/beta hydrolase [Nocardioides marmoriginsengisoli]